MNSDSASPLIVQLDRVLDVARGYESHRETLHAVIDVLDNVQGNLDDSNLELRPGQGWRDCFDDVAITVEQFYARSKSRGTLGWRGRRKVRQALRELGKATECELQSLEVE